MSPSSAALLANRSFLYSDQRLQIGAVEPPLPPTKTTQHHGIVYATLDGLALRRATLPITIVQKDDQDEVVGVSGGQQQQQQQRRSLETIKVRGACTPGGPLSLPARGLFYMYRVRAVNADEAAWDFPEAARCASAGVQWKVRAELCRLRDG